MVAILMMSEKLAALGLLKITLIKVTTSQFLHMKSATKVYHVSHIMWSCDQSLITVAFLLEVTMTKKSTFLRDARGSSSIIWNWH